MDEPSLRALLDELELLHVEIAALRRDNAMLLSRLSDEQGRLIELRERWGDERTL